MWYRSRHASRDPYLIDRVIQLELFTQGAYQGLKFVLKGLKLIFPFLRP